MITGTFGCVVVSEQMTAAMTKHNIIFVSAFAGDKDSSEPNVVVNFRASRMFEAINFENEIKDMWHVNWVNLYLKMDVIELSVSRSYFQNGNTPK